jgi:uncharacterized protein
MPPIIPQGNGTTPAFLNPVAQTERISIIDTVRGIALLGILLMNIPGFSMPHEIYHDLRIRNEFSGPDYYTWWIVNGLFEGTMRALFTMLFGAGSMLLLSRLEKKESVLSAADVYYRRMIWLLIFGMINAYIFLWPGDILYTYAICGMFLFPFRNMQPKHLLIFGIVLLLLGDLNNTTKIHQDKAMRTKGEKVLALLKKDSTIQLSTAQQADQKAWMAYLDKYKLENVRKKTDTAIKEMHSGYFAIMGKFNPINQQIQSSTFYHVYFLDTMCLLFIGMAFFKWGILTGQRSKQFYFWMMIGGYAIGLPLNYYMLHTFLVSNFDNSLFADKLPVFYYEFKRAFMSIGHLGLIMLFYKFRIFTTLQLLLAKVGQMAFTNYLGQSIICGSIFYGFGLGWYGTLDRHQLYYVVIAVWIFQICFSSIWLRYFYFGPFEWLWRSLTYWKKQPMRRRD